MYAEGLFLNRQLVAILEFYHPPSESEGSGCPEISHSEVRSSILLLTGKSAFSF